ncbi:MAG: ABC transporter permease subunit [Clostridiales bacterium]|nr:ABC transporter permease subunit [Clostridiales bacterium]
MLIPAVIFFLVFSYYPMLGLQIAFKDWKIFGGIWGSPWASTDGQLDLLKHFKLLFTDSLFFSKFINTLRISTLKLLCGFPVPIIIVVLLNEMRSVRYKKVVQTISYLPHFISWIIISGILLTLTASGSGFQSFLSSVFGKELLFFSDDNLFLVVIVLSEIWKESGWATIIYFAAISNIDPCLEEAAAIDGASRMDKIIHIILPGLRPAISINLILSLSGLVYGGFDQIFNMYNTAVYGKGDILETYLFRIGIGGGQYDVATALGLFNSVLALTLTLLANYIIKKKEGDGIW